MGRTGTGLLIALLLGIGLLLAAFVPGLGIVILIAIVVVVIIGGLALAAAGRDRREPSQPADLLGPGGPDDPSA